MTSGSLAGALYADDLDAKYHLMFNAWHRPTQPRPDDDQKNAALLKKSSAAH